MIDTSRLPDRELVCLRHRLNMSYAAFRAGYAEAQSAPLLGIDEDAAASLWRALDAEVGVRGIDLYDCTKETIVTTTKTEAI